VWSSNTMGHRVWGPRPQVLTTDEHDHPNEEPQRTATPHSWTDGGHRRPRSYVKVWFGSSYDLETHEIEGRADSFEVGAPLALVTQFETRIAPADLKLRLTRDGEVSYHDKVDVDGTDETTVYGFAGDAPPEPGTWTFDFTDTDGDVLATGEIEVVVSDSGPTSATASSTGRLTGGIRCSDQRGRGGGQHLRHRSRRLLWRNRG